MKKNILSDMNSFEHKTGIKLYVDKYINRRKEDKEYNKNAIFKIKAPNFSTEVSETLAKILIKEGELFKNFPETIYSVNTPNQNDIVINGKHVVEVKGTTSHDGLITLSDNNLKCYAWVWFDFNDVVNEKSKYAIIHVLKHPEANITPKFIATNREKKMTIKKLCRDLKCAEDYETYEYDVFNFKMMKSGDIQNEFFEIV